MNGNPTKLRLLNTTGMDVPCMSTLPVNQVITGRLPSTFIVSCAANIRKLFPALLNLQEYDTLSRLPKFSLLEQKKPRWYPELGLSDHAAV